MAWDFETDEEFEDLLIWIRRFVEEEVAPLDHLLEHPHDVAHPDNRRLVPPLQAKVKEMGLWACHLEPELGGQGYGQLKLALMNEVLGRARFAPIVFGCQAPDSGNAEILAKYGTEEHKQLYLQPLLDGDIVSCFSMTEPHAGSDPTMFTVRAELDGNHWVINGDKWFSSNARFASFLIVLAVTDPEAPPYRRMSMFIVPRETPGITILRSVNVGLDSGKEGTHGYVRYENVRIPADHMLGDPGDGFVVAQTRLGGGRIHHAMRTMGQIARAFDMMCERALSRETKGEKLAEKQMVQEKIADSWVEMEMFRLLVLRTAWKIDKLKDYRAVRKDIAAVKAMMPKVYHDVATRALQVHGALGMSNEMPLTSMVLGSLRMGIVDGPTEVHKQTVARQVLREHEGVETLFPSQHLPALKEQALARYGHLLDLEIGNE